MEQQTFTQIVNDSISLSEILVKLNLRVAGGNFKTIKKYIQLWNIDISHFKVNEARTKGLKIYAKKIKIPLEEVLVENSTYQRKNLKARLYREKLKERICEFCAQGENWRGKKISLILDHINGIWNDNRLENLRILCPNCNATLDTHCGKNVKRNKLSTDPDWRKKPRLKNRKAERPTIEQLSQDIKELGYTGAGRKYGVSDNAIRKWIK